MTDILNDLDLGWCTGASAKGLIVVAAGSRFVMNVRNQVSGVAEFSLSEMIAKT